MSKCICAIPYILVCWLIKPTYFFMQAFLCFQSFLTLEIIKSYA